MPYSERRFDCMICGAEVWRRASASAQVRCIDCAISRSVFVIRQMQTKSGEFYQRWADGIARAGREAQQLAAIAAEIDSIG